MTTETTDPLEQAVMRVAEAWAMFSDDIHNWIGENEDEWNKARERLRLHVQVFGLQSRLKEHDDSLTTCLYDHSTPVSCPRRAWLKHEIAALEARLQED